MYLEVIQKERKWDYLWKTVQIVPHVTDNIKERLVHIASFSDITIVEVGGTVWDIESLPFLEAIRQMKKDIWEENIAYIHLAPLLHLSYSWETKTKPIQHSVSKLREYGIFPDVLVCRTETPMNEAIKEKILYLYDNQDSCKEMGNKAKKKIESGYSWDDYGNRYIKNLETIWNKSGNSK